MTRTCPQCQTQNPPEARFCHRCGTALAAPNGATDGATEAGRPQDRLSQYIPPQLLAKLEAARRGSGRVAAERRVVTILFCDVQGSTALAEQLDPEEWAEIINGAFVHLIAPIYRYEGTLARLMGDAILAFFGAPIAHEDDPERAARAGLAIVAGIRDYRAEVRRRWGLEFDVRVGINTGLVVVGEVGSDLRVEYTALGDAVNLAARMEETAAPSTVQIAESTYRAVEQSFAVEDLGLVEVKGKAEPVRAYRVLRPLPGGASGGARELESLSSPLVARGRELRMLQQSVQDLLVGEGHIAVVMGEAGIGKSRLVAELRNWVRDRGLLAGDADDGRALSGLQWHEGRARSYDTMTPYAPFVDLLTDWFGLEPEQGDAAHYARIQRLVGQVLPERVAEIAPYLATMLGVTVPDEDRDRVRYLEPEQFRERIFGAVESFVAAQAARQVLVLVFEDLHWADPTSIALIERLLGLTDDAPLLLLAAFRPLRQERSWHIHETAARDYPHRYTLIELEPLDDDDARQLVANLLNAEGLHEEERARILAKTEGNPFFIEEVVRGLVEAGVIVREDERWVATQAIEAISIPSTVAGVLTARLDRLDEETRRVAQLAAVVGREFSYPVLEQVNARSGGQDDLERALRELQRRELIRERGRLPERRYRFKHVLTQEAAYNSLLRSRRRALHREVAEALEAIYPQRLDELRPLLAYHFTRAEQWTAALEHASRAGKAAQDAFANREALDLYQEAIDAAERAEAGAETCIALYRARGQVHETVGSFEEARADHEAAIRLARASGNRRAEWQALLDLGLLWASRDYGRTRDYYVQALELARQLNDPAALARSLNRLGNWHVNVEEPQAALGFHQEALAIFEALGDRRGLAETRDFLGMASVLAAQVARGMRHYEQAATLFQELDDRRGLTQSLHVLGLAAGFYQLEGTATDSEAIAAALDSGSQALALARQIGWRAQEAYILGNVSVLYGWRGEYARALELAESAHAIAEQIGHRQWLSLTHCALGALYLDLLAVAEARRHLETSFALAQEIGSVYWMRVSGSVLITTCIATGDLPAARALLTDRLDPDGPVQSLAHWMVRFARAELSLASGDPAEALRLAGELAVPDPEGEASLNPLRLGKLRAEALLALGNTAEAEAELRPAVAGARAQQIGPLLWRLHATLARVYDAQGRGDLAEQERASARTIIEHLAAGLPDGPLRATFLREAGARTNA